MRYYKATMDYRPNNPNKPQYYHVFKDEVNLKTAKEYYKTTFSWLKLYDCVEITEEEYNAYWQSVKDCYYGKE